MDHPRSRFIENFILVWLDSNIDEADDNTRNSIILLQGIVNSIKIFTDVDQCIDFISGIVDEKSFIIISGELSQWLVPLIEQFTQLNSIYIFCNYKLTYEQWVTYYKKVKGMFTDINAVCNALKQDIRLANNNLLPIGIIAPHSTTNLDELDQSFMYSQLLKEIILDRLYDGNGNKQFIDFCRIRYVDNDTQMKVIDEFEEKYDRSLSIWWYTRDCFIYSMLNEALRTQDTEVITKMAFFLRDLHRQIEQLYSEVKNRNHLNVFRGQGLLFEKFDKIKSSKGGLLSFNSFLSTSINRDVAHLYADSVRQNPDLVGIIFQIEIDPSVPSTPYASVREISYYQEAEEEILFSMHTVFRISDMEETEDRLWKVNLILTSENDPLLTNLIEYMREEIKGSTDMHRMGQLMIKMGKFDKAEEMYNILLGKASDDDQEEIAHLYHQLGILKKEKGDLSGALSFYTKTLEIMQKYFSSNHPDLATVYHNIGVVHKTLGEYPLALSYYKKTLEIEEKSLSSNRSNLATTYCNIGLFCNEMGDYSTALSYYEKALEIHQKSLPANHPFLSTTYNNIALAYDEMGEYLKALSYYEKTLEIQQKTLPSDHPLLATTYGNIALMHNTLGEYPSALSYCKKTLEIEQKSLPSNHPDLATTYCSIGLLHNEMEEYSTALSYYEKALEIQQKSLPANHPSLATTYNNIGLVYDEMGEYLKALSYYEKTLGIQQKSLASDHPSVATTFNNIGAVYYSMREYSISLSYYEKALEIRHKSLPSDHSDISSTYNNIGLALTGMGKYLDALSNYEKASESQQRTLPSNHPLLAATYNNIGLVYQYMEKYSTALSYYQKTLDIKLKLLSSEHPSLAIIYNNIGSIYHSMREYSTALSYYEKTFEIQQKSHPVNQQSLSITHYNTAKVLEHLQQYEKAIEHAQQAVAFACQALGSEHQKVKEYQKYLKFLLEKL